MILLYLASGYGLRGHSGCTERCSCESSPFWSLVSGAATWEHPQLLLPESVPELALPDCAIRMHIGFGTSAPVHPAFTQVSLGRVL